MKKKLYITILALLTIALFSYSFTFAANDMSAVDGIRNVVGGAENVVEDAGKGVVDGIRNVTSGVENTAENATGTVQNRATDSNMGGTTADGYSATRTTTRSATDTANNSFLGMNSTVWTWLIMAIVGIAIIALVWMYAKQNNNSYHDNNY